MKHLLLSVMVLLSLVSYTSAQDVEQLSCSLDPKCKSPGVRGLSFGNRAIKVEGTAPDEPRSVNLYINFAYNSADLAQDARITLDQLARALQSSQLESYKFRVEGHTDARGSAEYNQVLSEKRAQSVVTYLSGQHSINASRLSAIGFGKTQLLDPADPESSVNRRVQITNIGQ